ncbi:ABC transporter permease [Marinibaculum pumilum]|uniref:ABC transporter permease n=1 Tax=Marinibaculum pumilum TaxID=1766165 RepID=A0ABV7KTH8_9PROT
MTGTPSSSAAALPAPARPLGMRLAAWALPLILLLFAIFFSLAEPQIFPTTRTIVTILRTESVAAILAIALVFPLVVGKFDLSVGAVLGLGAILTTGLPSLQGLPLLPSIAIAIAACGTIGLVNGLLVARLGVTSLVATLGSSVIVTGCVLWYTGGNVLYTGIPRDLPRLAQADLAGIPLPAIFLAIVAIAAWYVLEATPLGRYFHAVGGSAEAARLSGLKVERLTIIAFVISGLLAGFAGVLQSAQLGSGNPNVGPPFLLPAFASAFLGATAVRIGTFNVWGTVIAVFTVAVGINGLQLMGVEFFVGPIFQGAALLAAVIATRQLMRKRS